MKSMRIVSLMMVVMGSAAVIGAEPQSLSSNAGTYAVKVAFMPALVVARDLIADIEVQCNPKISCREPDSILFDAIMPEHGHGMDYKPSVERVGSGHYKVSGIRLHMRGNWQVHVDIVSGNQTERAQFDVEL